jgi:hypothetical protein
MRRLSSWTSALVFASLSFSPSAAAGADAASEARNHDASAQVRQLSASPHADAWLLGAWISRSWCRVDADGCDPAQADRLFERVLAQPPENPTVLRVLIDQLPAFLAGDPSRLAAERARLLAGVQLLDPDSATSWLPALPDSTDPKRRAEGIAVLARAARSTSADIDFMRSYQWIASRLVELPLAPEGRGDASKAVDPESTRREFAMAIAVAIAIPSYQPLSSWCRDPSRAWAADCRTIARLLAGSDTLIDRMIGKGMLVRLASTGDERAEAERVGASAAWLMTAQQQCQVLDDEATLAAMELEGVTEVGLIEAGLQARGLPIEPPADAELRKRPCAEAST